MQDLTPIQKETLEFIVGYIDEAGLPPARDEIAEAFDITPVGVKARLVLIEKKGYIEMIPNIPRGIRVLKQP